jgi:hypothetical protein
MIELLFVSGTYDSGEEFFYLKEGFLAHFSTLCALCALDPVLVHKICRHNPKLHVCKTINFVGVGDKGRPGV